MKNWRERRKIAHQQNVANQLWPSGVIGGIIVKDEEGKPIHLNNHPKTDWQKEFDKATEKVFAKNRR